jgi:hypothetical protein
MSFGYRIPSAAEAGAKGANVADLTDSTGGTAAAAMAVGPGISVISFHVGDFADTGAGSFGATTTGDVITDYVPGFKFMLLNIDFVADLPGTGAGASAPCQLEIDATPCTGGLCTVTLASTSARGELTAGTVTSAANTGSATATISIVKATSVVFTAGSGTFLVSIQNMDVADAFASVVAKQSAILASLETVGLMAAS